MAINTKLLKALKAHKFKNGDIITYTSMNDENDNKTITDVANEIYKSFVSSSVKDKMVILNAIFDGVYEVVENKSSNKGNFGLVDIKKGEFAELKISLVKDVILFSTTGTHIKLKFKIATPDVVKSTSDWPPSLSKKELQTKLNNVKNINQLKEFNDTITNMLNIK